MSLEMTLAVARQAWQRSLPDRRLTRIPDDARVRWSAIGDLLTLPLYRFPIERSRSGCAACRVTSLARRNRGANDHACCFYRTAVELPVVGVVRVRRPARGPHRPARHRAEPDRKG